MKKLLDVSITCSINIWTGNELKNLIICGLLVLMLLDMIRWPRRREARPFEGLCLASGLHDPDSSHLHRHGAGLCLTDGGYVRLQPDNELPQLPPVLLVRGSLPTRQVSVGDKDTCLPQSPDLWSRRSQVQPYRSGQLFAAFGLCSAGYKLRCNAGSWSVPL